jgi:hypothetical protein
VAFESSSDNVRLLRRPLRAKVGGGILIAVIVAVCAGFVVSPEAMGLFLRGMGSLLAYLVAFAVLAWRTKPRETVAGVLSAGEDGVVWNNRRLARRDQIKAGFVIPSDGGPPHVRLVRGFPRAPLAFQVADEATGRALLAGLGLDAAQTIATLKLASLLRAKRHAMLGNVGCFAALPAIALLLALTSGAAWAITVSIMMTLGAALWAVLSLVPARARVGADGILIEWLGRRTFVGFEELRNAGMFVDDNNAGVELELTDGRALKLPAMGLFTAAIDRDELTLMVKRIEQAAEVHRRAQADRGVLLPQRGDRRVADWIRALRAVGTGANADHRHHRRERGSPPRSRAARHVVPNCRGRRCRARAPHRRGRRFGRSAGCARPRAAAYRCVDDGLAGATRGAGARVRRGRDGGGARGGGRACGGNSLARSFQRAR